jgi:hypothetical protein
MTKADPANAGVADTPVPVAPLGYEARRDDTSMPQVVRWVATAGLIVAALHLVQTAAQLSTMATQRTVNFANLRTVFSVGVEMLRGAAAVAMFVTSIDLLKLRRRWRVIAVVAACVFAASGLVLFIVQISYTLGTIGVRGFGTRGQLVLWAMTWATQTIVTEVMPVFFAIFFTRRAVRDALLR